jgi:hypothetical protein
MPATPASTPISTLTDAPEVKITYGQLSTFHVASLKPSNVRNHNTVLNGWLSNRGLTLESVVGDEFGVRYKEHAAAYCLFLEKKQHTSDDEIVKGLTEGTIKNYKTYLNQWRKSWLSLVAAGKEKAEEEKLPDEIPKALQHLVERRGMSPYAFTVAVGVSHVNFYHWYKGQSNPSHTPNTIKAFKRIERYCGLEEGRLTSLIRSRQVLPDSQDKPRTAYARRMMTAVHEKYKRRDFPPRLKAEWDEFYALMTTTLEPDGPIERNGYWFVDPENRKCPTAGKIMNTLAGFFGYLTLPLEGRSFLIPEKKKAKKKEGEEEGEKPPPKYTVVKGEGFSEDALTLALVSNVPLVKKYIEFVKGRAGGVYNTETEQIINLCCMLLRKKTGFVRQQPHYGARLQPPVPAGKWNKWCESAHERLREQLRKLKKNGQIEQSRNVEEPIDFIINDPHPLRYLYLLADLMEADMPAPSAKGVMRAVAYRDMFLVRFLTANPLRIKHFTLMTWRADNTGNLYQERDRSWWLRFSKDDFKNRKSLKKDKFSKDYRAPLPPSLWDYVKKYLSVYRPLLQGAKDCDYVFRPCALGGSGEPDDVAPMWGDSLGDTLHKAAERYLRCIGFGPHAYRHIIATDYLRNHPSGIMVAASILHDTPEMVLKHYGHLQKSDFFRYWVKYHETQFEAARNEATWLSPYRSEDLEEEA